jgi:hypothetical protein
MRSNSLIVSAPEPLFQEVKLLVAQLDQAGTESTETVQTIAIRRANPQVVQQALSSVMGTKVTVNQTASNATSRTSAGARAQGAGGSGPVRQGGGGNTGGGNTGGGNVGGGGQQDVFNLIRTLQGGGRGGGQGGGTRGGGSRGGR